MQIFFKTKNFENDREEVYSACSLTLQQFVNGLQELCNQGYGDRKVSCCGVTDFYIHTFDKNSQHVVIDTDREI